MKQVVVVFGGSFNPPTYAHFSLAEQVYSLYKEVEQVLFVPVSDLYPKKNLLKAEHRVKMLELVCEKNPHFTVSRIEVDSERLLTTIETLRKLQKLYKDYDIWFTMGTDNLKLMPHWVCHQEILENFKCLILERDQDKMNHILNGHEIFKRYKEKFIRTEDLIHSDCSSTLIRRLLKENRSIRYLLPDEVYTYIKEKGLYTMEDI